MEATLKQKIGKYEITGVLGRGGMGVVYRAEDKRIGRKVAIKTLTEGFSGQPEMLERFYREAQAGILQHPNIVIVYDLGDEDGIPFIVMEFVDGEPLDKTISSGRQLPMVEKLSIIEQVCSGLGYAHRRGVVHRDIKPANVMVQQDGHAKIVDFGIARVQSSSSEGGLTRTGNVIGTVHYIAPERLKGQPFDGRSDIFATGVMLYLLLTGQLPFTGEDMTVLQKLVNEPHPPLGNFLKSYPPQLDAIIDRALAKDPEQRYATAEEFAADLHGLGEELKKGQAAELYSDAERLAADQQFGRAREVLLQLVRIDPQHPGARQLLTTVQQNLARMQRVEQIRQMIAEAEEAIVALRFPEALNALDQAIKLDPENGAIKAKIAETLDKKQRHDQISGLMTQADSLGQRGDWTGAANVVEKAMSLDQSDTKIRALFLEYSRQAKIAAQQGQIRELLGQARLELGSRRFTQAIEILREVGKIDPSQTEMEELLQNAVSGQEQERRRKLLEQIHAEIENCLAAEDYDRATMLVERSVEQLPTESSLLQLKGRVTLQARNYRTKKLIATTVTTAQETFLHSPGEALLIVQKALQELPGEERLLALEDNLRQRLKAAEKEEVRGRYLREAQDAMGKSRFDQAIEILESYQVEFNDATGVSELLAMARNELTQQQRKNRTAAAIAQARGLMEEQRFDDAIRLLEPAAAETGDASLQRLLVEARSQREEAERKIAAHMAKITRLRERGELDEALQLLQAMPAAQIPGSQAHTLTSEIRKEQSKKQAISKALSSATAAIEKGSFQAAIESLESVQRAWGETPELKRGIAEIEARRRELANEAVAKAIDTARGTLGGGDAAGAIRELNGVAAQVEFADQQVQADWKRLGAEAAKPAARRPTGTVQQIAFEGGEEPKKKSLVPMIAGGAAVLVLGGGGLFYFLSQGSKQPAQQPVQTTQTVVPAPVGPTAAPTGTLLVQGKLPDVMVFVDGAIKGFTQHDGTLKLSLDPGKHTIRLVKAGYTDFSPAPVTIAVNQQQSLPFDLKQQAGATPPVDTTAYLTVQSTAGAWVSIDHVPQGNVDSSGVLIKPIKAGTHTIDVGKDGYQAFSQSLSMKPSDHTTVQAGLTLIPPKPTPTPVAAAPTALFSVSSGTIEQGQATTLSWQTANASSVSIDPGIGSVEVNGAKEVKPESSTTYTLTAKGNGGTQQKTVSIVVQAKVERPTPAPTPAPAPTPVDETPAVEAVLSRFNAALASHDVGQMQAAGLKAPEAKSWQNFFKGNPNGKVVDNCATSSLNISGDSANWSCTESVTVISGGKPLTSSHPIHFTFSKRGGTWSIADRH